MSIKTIYVDSIIILDQEKPGNFIVRKDSNEVLSLPGIKNEDKSEAPKKLIAKKFNFNGTQPKFDSKYTYTFTENNVDGQVFLLETQVNYHEFCSNNEISGEHYLSLSFKEIQNYSKARKSLKKSLLQYSDFIKPNKKTKKNKKKEARA